MPKSSSFAPFLVSITFAGFRSRCTMPRLVGRVERFRDLNRILERLRDRQGAFPETFGQRLPFQRTPSRDSRCRPVADVVERADMRMIQLRDEPRLALEPRAAVGVVREVRAQQFDRDRSIKPRVAREVDLAHSADAEGRLNFVRAEVRARIKSQWRCEGLYAADSSRL